MKIRLMEIEDFDSMYNLWKRVGLNVADLKTEKKQTSQMIKFSPRSNFVAIKEDRGSFKDNRGNKGLFMGKQVKLKSFNILRKIWIYRN